jgi:hypothetical protein
MRRADNGVPWLLSPTPLDDRNEDGEGGDGDDEEHFRT